MSKERGLSPKQPEERGGYPAGDTLVSELPPPPAGPAPGAKKPAGDPPKK